MPDAGILSLLLASLAASQGQALELTFPNEPGLTAIEASWEGYKVPFMQRGDTWLTLIGVDLDTKAGEHAAEITFHYADGRTRKQREPVTVNAQQFPTTELKVEDRYVELSPEDEARARAEGQETADIYATLTPEMYWSEPFIAPITGAKDGRNFGHRRVFNGQPRAPHGGADLRATTGTPVYAANRGRVVLAKNLFYSGNAVFIDHGLGSVHHVFALLRDQGRAGHHRRAGAADRARGRDGPRDRAASALGRADRRRARRSFLAAENRGEVRMRWLQGRNEPCHCGSGKKYKHCCALKADKTPLGTRIVVSLVALMLLIGAVVMLRSIDNLDDEPTGPPGTFFSR